LLTILPKRAYFRDTFVYVFSRLAVRSGPGAVKRRRFDILMQKQQEIARDINGSLMGKAIDVIIDEKSKDNMYIGRSQADAPEVDGCVFVRSQERLSPGDIVKVRITETYEYDLVGEKTSS